MPPPRPILIAGPTASGKSGLALALAERLGGTVINADSMQVYRELRMLTARPTPGDEARAPHALYGFVPGARPIRPGAMRWMWQRPSRRRERLGACPSWSAALGSTSGCCCEGCRLCPPSIPLVRAYWRAAGNSAARRRSCTRCSLARDPATAARLMPTDPQRIVRALEVLESTGRSLADWQREPGTPVLRRGGDRAAAGAARPCGSGRGIEARFDAMMARRRAGGGAGFAGARALPASCR